MTSRHARGIGAGFGTLAMLIALTTSCGGDPVPTDPTIESSVVEGAAESGTVDDRIRKVAESLDLTDAQADAIEVLAARYAGEDREPGTAWYAAAALQTILDSEQIATIASRRAEAGSRNHARGHRKRSARADGQGPRGMAESDRRGPEGVTRGVRWLDQVDLTQEQRARVRAVFESRAEEFEALRGEVLGGELTREQARERARALREEVRVEIERILTPEQRSRLAERRAEAEQKREQRRLWAEASHEAMIQVLELTDHQVEELEALRGERMTPGTRPPRAGREDGHREAIGSILTESQLEVVSLHRAIIGPRGRARGRTGRREPSS